MSTNEQYKAEMTAALDALAGAAGKITGKKIDANAAPATSVEDGLEKSAGYAAFRKAFEQHGTHEMQGLTFELPLGFKANESVTSAGVPGESYDPAINPLYGSAANGQKDILMSILPSRPVESNFVRVISESTATNSAAPVAELGTMAQSVSVIADESHEVEKIGHVAYVSDELVADLGAFSEFLQERMAEYLNREETDQAVNGNGTTPQLNGLLAVVTQTQALASDTPNDCIRKAIADCSIGTYGNHEATHILIHPTDAMNFALQKDSDDNYLAVPGGPYWGLRPIVTQTIAQGTALVGAFSDPGAVMVYRRQTTKIEVSNSHASLFVTGQVAVRATSRLSLVVKQAAAFSEVTGLTW